ncbi:sulfurtransferase [Sinobaca sp. H24]|uniref:sulfurtransferase n=1 Tax=Sinobaca sp. H24 TaxID=2923376 RepID=UPI00207960B2|nr:sulfurtransferase [Sinobaca sp. H24]
MLLWITAIILGLAAAYHLSARWVPAGRASCTDLPDRALLSRDTIILDIREYQDAAHNPVSEAQVLPYPYLKRYLPTIEKQHVFLIAPDKVSKNLAIRLLRRNNIHVARYTIVERSTHGRQPLKAPCN